MLSFCVNKILEICLPPAEVVADTTEDCDEAGVGGLSFANAPVHVTE